MKKAYAPHLVIIQEAINAIGAYRPANENLFLENPMLQDAILMRLQVIGEHLAHIRHINEDYFSSVADKSWIQLIGLRNIISHGYEKVDVHQIWQIVDSDLPNFTKSLARLTDRTM